MPTYLNEHNDNMELDHIKKLSVGLGEKAYDIHIGSGLIENILSLIPADLKKQNVFVLTDENVSVPHGTGVYEAVKASGAESVQMLALPAGEQTKSLEHYERVMAWLLDHGVNRHSVLFAAGGGVIGDICGFAAATVLRGIRFVQVPTTLLAQVDSSVGGKTGINMKQGKNLVGAFHQPISVICDLNTLKTLPRRELLAGYAEILKYGLIDDSEFFIWLEANGKAVCDGNEKDLTKAIEISCRKKAEIVAADEKETGQRMLLNLGHTFGHALEVAAGFDGRLLHGEAVAIGMVLAAQLSARLGLMKEKDVQRIEDHVSKTGLPTSIKMIFPPLEGAEEDIISYMKQDKKISDGKNRFILMRAIGKAFITDDVPVNDVMAVIEHSIKGQ